MHEGIIEKLYQEYTVHGFISEDYIFDVLEENRISLFDVEYICDHLLTKGVVIRNEALTDDEEDEYDRSNVNYEEVFSEILEIDDTFTDFIEYIRGIKPPQRREWMNLMPQVRLKNAYARNRIFEMYMKVAVRIALIHAKKYHLSLDETIQNAMMGLYVSIDKYETADIFKQRTYRCAECGAVFTPNSNRQKYCTVCGKRIHRKQKTESERRRRSGTLGTEKA